jgi:hypothetical protein
MMFIRRSALSLLAGLLFLVVARPAVAQYPLLDQDAGVWYYAPVRDPATGHWYQVGLAVGFVTWDVARAAAEAQTYSGYQGHLATITSAAENSFVKSFLSNSKPIGFPLWLGGYQEKGATDYSEPAGGWRWVTDEAWSYSDWLPGQPDNLRSTYGGDADALAFNNLQGWDNFAYSSFSGLGVPGYVVEYEPAPPTIPPPPPLPPQNLTATAASLNQVNLSWADRSDNEDGFEIYRMAPGYPWVLIARLAPNITSLVDTAVVPTATYIYQVRAYNHGAFRLDQRRDRCLNGSGRADGPGCCCHRHTDPTELDGQQQQ